MFGFMKKLYKYILILIASLASTSFLLGVDSPHGEELEKSIVPPHDRISDFDVHWALARIYSHKEESAQEALKEYEWLHRQKPENIDITIEMSYLYTSMKKYRDALDLLFNALEKEPENPKLLVAAAQAEGALGNAWQARDLFLKALQVSNQNGKILVDYANAMMMWGDFYQAEKIFRNALCKDPANVELHLSLAWSLVSAQRYEEAEGIYRQVLLTHPAHPKVLEAFTRLRLEEKKFNQSLSIVENLLKIDPINPRYLQLKAEILFMLYRYCEAIDVYSLFKDDPKYGVFAYVGIGKSYQKLHMHHEAHHAFENAFAANSNNIEAQYYISGTAVSESCFLNHVISSFTDPEELVLWANLYSQNGLTNQALTIYETILKVYPYYFPGHIGFAEALSVFYRHCEAIEVYQGLLDAFPENAKLMKAIARLLAWSKNYEASLQYYTSIIELEPNDPTLYREKARVAMWGKYYRVAMAIYNQLLFPSVDQLLFEALKNNTFDDGCRLNKAIDDLSCLVNSSLIYQGYEEFAAWFIHSQETLNERDRIHIQEILNQYLPTYLIQKSIVLEKRAKKLVWKKYYIHSLDAYRVLLEFTPGNEEALFDYAQSFCSLGLCNCSREVYKDILHIDPGHNLVEKALYRNEMKSNFCIFNNFSYWRELGTGTFSQSQIARYKFETVFEQPLSCRAHLRFIQEEYVENPFYNYKFYPAEGQTLEADCIFNKYVSAFVSATYKTYFNKFKSVFTCRNQLMFNMNDYYQVVVACNKENEIYNYFSLKQATQSIDSWVTVSSNLTRYWNLSGMYQYYLYNDHNHQTHYNVTTEYQFTEDPNTLKVILRGDYRNTAHDSILILDGTKLVDVIYPYWTPIDYYSGSITFAYRYDFRYFDFCEAPLRYIDVKITGETDSVNNPSIQAVIEWKYEYDAHLGFEFKGLVHRSNQWNAEGAWGTVYYRF
jgi:tetratricopeptide (TPR) repeat protein